MPTRRKVDAPRSAPRLRCAACGGSLRPTHRFCPNCGSPVAAASALAPSPTPTMALPAAPRGSTAGGPSLQIVDEPFLDLSENRRLVTVLFADLSGSTTLGERLDPEDLRRILASYFGVLSRHVQRHGGTVDKYIGDAIMAVYGAPVAHEDDAARAVSTALAMQGAIARLNDDLEREYGARLALRIGINTGEVVAGLLSGDVHGAYTVVGDTVNTAQRFESNAPLGGILVSETTWRLTRRSFDFEAIPPLTLKGKAEPQPAHRVLRRRHEEVELPSTPLIGRQAELERLRSAQLSADEGRGRLLHVVGDAGVGKSRLIHEFRSGLRSHMRQLVGRCVSFETDRPFALIARLLRQAVRLQPGDDAAAARAAIEWAITAMGGAPEKGVTALLLDVLGYGENSAVDPHTRRRVLLSTMRRLLGAFAQRTSLLVVAEDTHWAD